MAYVIIVTIALTLIIGGMAVCFTLYLLNDYLLNFTMVKTDAIIFVDCIVAILVLFIFGGGNFLLASAPREEYGNTWIWESVKETEINKIYSLKVTTGASGNFCLGSGTIKNKDYYYYYVKTENGLYKQDKIENDGNVYIKPTDVVKPNISYYKEAWASSLTYIISVPSDTITMLNYTL